MPYYSYKCTTCEKEFEIHTTIANRHTPENEDCDRSDCNLVLTVTSPRIGYDNFALTGKKPSEGFKDRLREIKKHHPKANFNHLI